MIARLLRALTGRHHTVTVSVPESTQRPTKMTPADRQRAEDDANMFGNRVHRGLTELGYAPGMVSVSSRLFRVHVSMPVRLGQHSPEQLVTDLTGWLDTHDVMVQVHDERPVA